MSIIERLAVRYTQDDYWGNAAAGILPLAKTTGRLLLNHRSAAVNEPRTWGVWGGKLEGQESFRRAAIREFTEEAQYGGSLDLNLLHTYQDGEFEYRTFLGVVDREFTPSLDWESDGFRWVEVEEMEAMYGRLHFGLQEVVDHAIRTIERESESVDG